MLKNAAAKTVLLVDDEPSNLHSLSRYLRHEPYRILIAESGEQALNILATESVDVLVTDLRMPYLDGLELLWLASALYPKLVRLVLSATTEAEEMKKVVDSGMVFRFITKPLVPQEFKQILQDAICYCDAPDKPS